MRVDQPVAASVPMQAERAVTGKDRVSSESGSAGRERVAIGYVARPKGVRGEAVVEPLTGDVDRFADVDEVIL